MSQRIGVPYEKDRRKMESQWNSNPWDSSVSSDWNEEDWNNYYYGFNPYQATIDRLGDYSLAASQGDDSFLGRQYSQYLQMALEEQALRKDRFQQWYNSEKQRNSRLQNAGLNGDLIGLDQASEFNGHESQTPQFGQGDRQFDQSMQIMGAVQSSIDQAMQLTGQVVQMRNNILDARGSQIAQSGAMLGLAEYGVNSMNINPGNEIITAQQLFPGRSQRALRRNFISAFHTARNNYGVQSRRSDSHVSALRGALNEAAVSSVITPGNEVPVSTYGSDSVFNHDLVSTMAEIAEAGFKISKAQTANSFTETQLQATQLANSQKYEAALDPEMAAGAVNAQNKAVISGSGYEDDKNKTRQGFSSFIEQKIRENANSPFAQIAWSLFGTTMFGLLDNGIKLPAISYSRDKFGNPHFSLK